MTRYRLKAAYENGVLKPDRPLDIPEGAEVTIAVIYPFETFRGILRSVKEDSVSLQHTIGKHWGADGD